jgi:hypothetical protein
MNIQYKIIEFNLKKLFEKYFSIIWVFGDYANLDLALYSGGEIDIFRSALILKVSK